MDHDFTIYDTPEQMAETFASELVKYAKMRISESGQFSLALTGGNTPRALYARLGQPPAADALDWGKVKIFFGDERSVGPDHPDSNYGMAREAWLGGSAVPEANIFRMEGECPNLIEAAERYSGLISREVPGEHFPQFDLVLLGMGGDGHIASLFPGTRALHSVNHIAVANEVPQLETWRLTLTYPTINEAREVWMLVTGQNKAERIGQLLGGLPGAQDLPAYRVGPVHGKMRWWLDPAAASKLKE